MLLFPYKLYQAKLTLPVLIAIGYLFLTSNIYAEELSSEKFVIKMGTINIGSGTKNSPTIKLVDTLGQNLPGEFETTGFRLKSGFAYLPSKEPFSFTISADSINFGTLLPNTFYRKKIDLTVNGIGVAGYRVSLIESQSLSLPSGESFIPDTTCDPSQTCTTTTAAPWAATTAYGFGYTLSGDDIDKAQFPDQSYYRPLPNNTKQESPITIMSRLGRGKIATASATFAVNISATQPNGVYENSIQFIALPSY